MDESKVAPYQRLKNILTDGDPVSNKAYENLDELLGEKKIKKISLIDKISSFFRKIDSLIFKKPSKITNTPHKRMK